VNLPSLLTHNTNQGKGQKMNVLNAVKSKLLARVVSRVNNQRMYVKIAA
jgi:hypothetical protein